MKDSISRKIAISRSLCRVCVLEAKKIQKVWIAEYQVWRQLVALTQRLEFHLRKLLGPSRKSGSLEEHRLNLLLQSPRIPALYATHFRIKLSAQQVFNR